MRHAVFLMLSTLTLASAVPATGQPGVQICDLSAYVSDRDPNGTNVRAGPSSASRVLRVVPNGSAVATISGQSGAWFRVSAIVDAEDDRTLFRGTGWVHASLLGLSVANLDPRLYSLPHQQSRPVARLVPDTTVVTLTGCTGIWARVRAGRHEGWLSRAGQCSSPLTTCA